MISVCLASHNGEKYLKEQITSIIHQLNENDELIISDDGSTDATLKIISEFNDSRIHVVNKDNKGLKIPPNELATRNFENALLNCKGDYIFLSDQDDVWVDNKVETSLKYLKEYDYIVSDAYVTDADLNVIYETRFMKEEKIHTNKYMALVFATPYQGSCAAFRREVLEKALPFPKGLQSHDRWIGNVAAFLFNVKIIPEKLIYYRRHEGTASNSFGGGKASGLLKTLHYKWIYVWNILKLKIIR